MLKIIPLLSLLLLVGCSNSETTSSTSVENTVVSNPQCYTLSSLLEDMNLIMDCDGQNITESGNFVFSTTNNGKTMVALEYNYMKDNQKKENYFNGVLKKNSTPVDLVEGKKYTMSCTLNSAIFEECTIKPFE